MYCLVSIILIFAGIQLNDIRMLIFSAVFAFIDTLGDFRKREITNRYILQSSESTRSSRGGTNAINPPESNRTNN